MVNSSFYCDVDVLIEITPRDRRGKCERKAHATALARVLMGSPIHAQKTAKNAFSANAIALPAKNHPGRSLIERATPLADTIFAICASTK
jgi:hypothetical protein